MSDSRADDARYAAERVMEPILRRWLAIDLEPVNLWSNAENAAVDLSYALEDASIIADHIRDLARLRSAPSLSPTVDDLEAYIDLALIRWVPGDDAGLARHIAESIHPRLVPVSPSVDPEEEP